MSDPLVGTQHPWAADKAAALCAWPGGEAGKGCIHKIGTYEAVLNWMANCVLVEPLSVPTIVSVNTAMGSPLIVITIQRVWI